MMLRLALVVLIFALPAAAHEVKDPPDDQMPPEADEVDLLAVRLSGNETLRLEVEMAVEGDTSWELDIRLHRDGGSFYHTTCTMPAVVCSIVEKSSSGAVSGDEIPLYTTLDGPVILLESFFTDWSDEAFVIERIEAGSRLLVAVRQSAEVYAPIHSDELTADLDWRMEPEGSNGTAPRSGPIGPAVPPNHDDRTIPAVPLAWLLLGLLAVRR